jgi:hypothetical protein
MFILEDRWYACPAIQIIIDQVQDYRQGRSPLSVTATVFLACDCCPHVSLGASSLHYPGAGGPHLGRNNE